MPDLLVRNLDADVYERMRKAAEEEGKSLVQTAREALTERFRPTKQDAWAEIDRIRARIGHVSGDSTALIREDRDNDERYR